LVQIGPSRPTHPPPRDDPNGCFRLDAVRQALPTRAGQIAVALLGEPNRGMSSRLSLAVAVGGPKAGQWFDHELGVGGDMIDLIQHTRGCDFLGALRYAQGFIRSTPIRPALAPWSSPAAATDDLIRNQERALKIWSDAQPIACTTPTAVLVRQVLGAIAQFEKSSLVAKLKAARDRKRAKEGKCGGRKSYAEAKPEVVALAKELSKQGNRKISAELAARNRLTAGGKPYVASAVQSMLERGS
jgi:hypothetical protein